MKGKLVILSETMWLIKCINAFVKKLKAFYQFNNDYAMYSMMHLSLELRAFTWNDVDCVFTFLNLLSLWNELIDQSLVMMQETWKTFWAIITVSIFKINCILAIAEI